MNKIDNTGASDRFLDYLSHAYRVPFEPGAMEEFLASAADCLLYSEQNSQPSADIENIAQLSQKHADHNDRLHKIFDAHALKILADPAKKWSKQHAVGNIIVELSTGTCFGNVVAQDYLGQSLPASLDTLNLTAPALAKLTDVLRGNNNPDALGPDNLIQIANQSGDATIPSRVSFSHSDRGPIAEVTFFLFAWDLDSLSEFRDQFGLTKTETIVLALVLNGKSQAEIAEDRNRSLDTIKVQVRSLLNKTNSTKSSELVRQVMGYQILRLALQSQSEFDGDPETIPVLQSVSDETITIDGRSIQISQFGPTDGRPVLLVHGLIWGPFATPTMLRILYRENIRLIAPYRAGFGGSAPPENWADFNTTVVADYCEIVERLGIESTVIVAHQGGTSHGCRIAAKLGDRAAGLMILSGGVPINDVLHLDHMNTMTRIGAVACRYAPSIMETVMRAGIYVWQKRGPEKFLEQALSNSKADLAALRNAESRIAMVHGALNMISQGSKTAVHDGMAAMADWTADYDAVTCDIKWLHGVDDPVIHPKSIAHFLETRSSASLQVVDHAGVSLLYSHPEAFIDRLLEFKVFNP